MAGRFTDRILKHMAAAEYRPQRLRALARSMEVADADYGEFRRAAAELIESGRIAEGGGSQLSLPDVPRVVVGLFRGNRRGFGFVTPTPPVAQGDLHVPAGATGGAQDGDTVKCRVMKRPGRRGGKVSFVGEVVAIVSRGTSRVVGRLHRDGERWYVQPDGARLREPVFVDDVGAKHARSGDQVVAEIIRYPEPGKPARGVIVERLGAHGQPGVDLVSIIRQFDLPDVFNEAALNEARAAVQRFDADAVAEDRLDLRGELIITIDPRDARDFDDAISLKRLGGARSAGESAPGEAAAAGGSKRRRRSAAGRAGGAAVADSAVWELGVHIADVSYFVPAGGPLDADARKRGTSVYFPGHVLPMLPEVLSNGVCSLQQGVPRLCKSAFIRYDADGKPVSARFANSVISSMRRLTYEDASAALEGRTGGIAPDVVELLLEMERLARTIRRRRLSEGMLVLDLPEVELELDEDGRVVDAHPADTSFSHTIIEMFMVEANEAVARRLDARGVAFLRRVHPDPEPEALANLSLFLHSLGVKLPKHAERMDLQRMLDLVRGKPTARLVNLCVLKSMAQAFYAPGEFEHYALASRWYCHFTSPIRRYPDLHIHRLLDVEIERDRAAGSAVASGGPGAGARSRAESPRRSRSPQPSALPTPEEAADNVDELGAHCSRTERRAQDAERELRQVKVLELLTQHVGDVFDGPITGVASFGIFVQHPRYLIEGLVEVIDLPSDRWELDSSRSRLTGRRGGRYQLGDVIRVAIARVDVPTRRLILAPTESRSARSDAAAGRDRAIGPRSRQRPGKRERRMRRGR